MIMVRLSISHISTQGPFAFKELEGYNNPITLLSFTASGLRRL